MARRFTKKDIAIRIEHGAARPTINIKVRNFGNGITPEDIGCDETTHERALTFALRSSQQQFWEDAKEAVAYRLGRFSNAVKPFQTGSSGGWLYVVGLYPVKYWDAMLVSAWGLLVKDIQQIINGLCDIEAIKEAIRENRWNEIGASQYNFHGTIEGDECLVDVKKRILENITRPDDRNYVAQLFRLEEKREYATCT